MYQVKHFKIEPSDDDTQVEVNTTNKLCKWEGMHFTNCSSSHRKTYIFNNEPTVKTEQQDASLCGITINHNTYNSEEETKLDINKIKIKQEIFEDDPEEPQKNDDSVSVKVESIVKTETQENILSIEIKSENITCDSEDDTYYCEDKAALQRSEIEHVHLNDKNLQGNTSQGISKGDADSRSKPQQNFCDGCSNNGTCNMHLIRHATHSSVRVPTWRGSNFKADMSSSFKKFTNNHTREPYMSNSKECGDEATLVKVTASFRNEKPFGCDFCDYRTTRKTYLVSHLTKHSEMNLLKCNECDFKCDDKPSLNNHKRTQCSAKSSGVGQTKDSSKRYSCTYCDYKCNAKSYLAIHHRKHTGEKPYACSHCDYKCREKSTLTIHNRRHTGDKPYACAFCDYKCSVKSYLIKHNRQHTGEKPYACSYCDYRCREKSALNMHNRKHTGEKPFACNYCDYKCSQKSDITKHKRKHTGEKPFVCKFCDYKCSRKTGITKHEKKHTDTEMTSMCV